VSNLIIGHRGFVGSNLALQVGNYLGVGREEIPDCVGKTFSNIYCAAPQAKKWWANANPELDRLQIDSLVNSCLQLKCKNQFILFSTVDVYSNPYLKSELDHPGVDCQPYGANRLYLEECIAKNFGDKSKIIRLPALVGNGLKKNVMYDLLNDHQINCINANSSFQWFNLFFLKDILGIVEGLQSPSILNVVAEPLLTADIVRKFFPQHLDKINWSASPSGYNLHTIYGASGSRYLYSRQESIDLHLAPFVKFKRLSQ